MSQNAGFTPHSAGSALTYPGTHGDSVCRGIATRLVLMEAYVSNPSLRSKRHSGKEIGLNRLINSCGHQGSTAINHSLVEIFQPLLLLINQSISLSKDIPNGRPIYLAVACPIYRGSGGLSKQRSGNGHGQCSMHRPNQHVSCQLATEGAEKSLGTSSGCMVNLASVLHWI